MAGETLNAHAWAEADIYVAPFGATEPTTLVAAWDAVWEPVGLLDGEAGVTQARDGDTSDQYAWGGILVRTTKSKHKRTFQFTALEDNAITFGLLNPGSTVSTASGVTTRVVKTPTTNVKAFAIEYRDGPDITKRVIIRRGEVTEVGDITEGEEDLTAYELTVTCYANADGTQYVEILPDPEA